MFVIEVIPLSRGTASGALTYYSSLAYPIGSLITIPLRSKEVRGLVSKVDHLSAAKTAVRAATFTLRRLPEQDSVTALPANILNTASALSNRYPATLGALLYALLPPEVRDGSAVLDSDPAFKTENLTADVSVLCLPFLERLDVYRRRIREAFAHRGSVLVVVPSSVYVERLVDSLSYGIAERVVAFSPAYSAKKIARAYRELGDLSVSKLIIVTPAHAFVDRHDIIDIIVDQSRSPHYRARSRPFLDYQSAFSTLAAIAGRRLLFGDILIRPEDEWYRRDEIYESEGENLHRLHFDNRLRVIKQKDKPSATEPFQLFSPELQAAIDKTLASKGSVFLYAARRGLAPVVACGDCGFIFRCPDSGTPYSLLRTFKDGEEKRWFVSSTSGRRTKAEDNCPVCGSWRLRGRGIGIQHIYDELRAIYPPDKIVLFDHTTAKNPRRAAELIYEFYDKKGGILVGTAMALPYLEDPVQLSAIVSVDAARALPTWRADEEFFALLLGLREITTDTVLIQTRSEPDEIIEYAKTGQIERFFDDELALRRNLEYPPFSVLIHLTITGTASALRPLEAELLEGLKDWHPVFYSSPESQNDRTIRYGLIKLAKAAWPDARLLDQLRILPPSVRIEINPARIV